MAGNAFDEDMPDCPLCMEPFGFDDINFFPCVCRYQVCRFCWHRIRTDENGLCPHCREPYTENPAEYTPLSQEQLSKLKSEKKQKTTERKQKLMESRKNLADVRVIQKNLVFVVGLSPRLADLETLRKNEYFGKYGRIFKVVINNHTVYNGTQGPSVSAYVTFYREEDALKAISAVNNAYIDGRYLKASFGTTKYCTTFLRGSQCTKLDCMYLHALGDNDASFTKEDMHLGKHQVYEQSALAAANIDPKELTNDASILGPVVTGVNSVTSGVVKVKGTQVVVSKSPILVDGGEGSALPSTASWAASCAPKPPEGPASPQSHSKEPKSHSKTNKQRSTSNHSPKSHALPSSPKSSSHRQSNKQKTEHMSKSGSPSPVTFDRTSSGSIKAQRTASTSSITSSDSPSSKPITPSLSPKSLLSKSLSSGSLNQDSSFESPESGPRPPTQYLESEFRHSNEVVETEDFWANTDDSLTNGMPAITDTQADVHSKPVAMIKPEPVKQTEPSSTRVSPLVQAVTNSTMCSVDAPDTEGKVVGQESTGRTVVTKDGGVLGQSKKIVGGQSDDVLNVLSGLSSTGSSPFGSLGVSWNSQVPSTLVGSNASAPTRDTKTSNSQQEDDLGFDPWDVSQQGLADLLETEAEEQRNPLSKHSVKHNHKHLSNGVGEYRHVSSSALPNRPAGVNNIGDSRDPWQDELRTLFPDVNISFGRSGFPSTATKLKSDKPSSSSLHQAVNAMHTTTSYHPTQLANALNYSYNPLQGTTPTTSATALPSSGPKQKSSFSSSHFSSQSSGSSFPVIGFPASSTKVNSSECRLPGGRAGGSDWPSFGEGGASVDGKKTVKETESKEPVRSTTVTPPTTFTHSLPSPPPGFVAKPAFPSTNSTNTPRSTSKVVPPSTVAGPANTSGTVNATVGGGSLSSSVNHALWANAQAQGKGHVVPNHLLQSWNNFLNFSALTPAQQQQLARSSQNYQHLLAQQYLLMQGFLMRGYPLLQAQAQAQAQIQASLRAQLQQHALRQQQQQQAGTVVGAVSASVSIPSPSTMVKAGPKGVTQSSKSSVVSTISSSKDGASNTAPTTSTPSTGTHTISTSTKGALHNGKPSSASSSKGVKHGPTNLSTSSKGPHQNHHHHVSSKNKTASGNKQTKSHSSNGSSEKRAARHKNSVK